MLNKIQFGSRQKVATPELPFFSPFPFGPLSQV